MEENHPTKQDHYLAQIAAWICRVSTKDPEKVKINDFLLEFKPPGESKQTPEQAKNVWAGALGIDIKEQKKRKKRK